MNGLIIKKYLGTEGLEYFSLLNTAQEEGFINSDIPSPEGLDDSFMCRCRPAGNGLSSDVQSSLYNIPVLE